MVEYRPNTNQLPIHLDGHAIRLVSGGEGSGKSFLTAGEWIGYYPLMPLTYIVGPKYQSCYPEFDYISEHLVRMGRTSKKMISRPTQGAAMLITVDGNVVQTISSEDGTKAITGTGKSPDCILMVEAGKQSYDIFLACLRRVSRSRGMLFLSGTIEQSEPWYPDMVERWLVENPEGGAAFILPTWTNLALYPGGENDPEILRLKAILPPDVFNERLGGKPTPPAGLVLKEFGFPTHVSDLIKYVPGYPVEIWVDPGYSGTSMYAVEFTQVVPRAETIKLLGRNSSIRLQERATIEDVLVIDEIYRDRATTYEVIKQAKENQLWGHVRGGVGDTAIRQHAALPSHLEIWRSEAGIWLRNKKIAIDENVLRHRSFLSDPATGEPRMFFNPKVTGALREYRKWVRKPIGDTQYGDPSPYNCDALKALGYGLIDHFGYVERPKTEKAKTKQLFLANKIMNAKKTRR